MDALSRMAAQTMARIFAEIEIADGPHRRQQRAERRALRDAQAERDARHGAEAQAAAEAKRARKNARRAPPSPAEA